MWNLLLLAGNPNLILRIVLPEGLAVSPGGSHTVTDPLHHPYPLQIKRLVNSSSMAGGGARASSSFRCIIWKPRGKPEPEKPRVSFSLFRFANYRHYTSDPARSGRPTFENVNSSQMSKSIIDFDDLIYLIEKTARGSSQEKLKAQVDALSIRLINYFSSSCSNRLTYSYFNCQKHQTQLNHTSELKLISEILRRVNCLGGTPTSCKSLGFH